VSSHSAPRKLRDQSNLPPRHFDRYSDEIYSRLSLQQHRERQVIVGYCVPYITLSLLHNASEEDIERGKEGQVPDASQIYRLTNTLDRLRAKHVEFRRSSSPRPIPRHTLRCDALRRGAHPRSSRHMGRDVAEVPQRDSCSPAKSLAIRRCERNDV
jgi:hypothetical protein